MGKFLEIVIPNYKVFLIAVILFNFICSLILITVLTAHFQRMEMVMAKIDRATQTAEAISSVYATNVPQKEGKGVNSSREVSQRTR